MYMTDSDNNMKLIDFGLSNRVKVDDYDSNEDLSKVFTLKTPCGTPHYAAPELIQQQPYGSPIDIWSLGVITYLLLCGFPPFFDNDIQEMFYQIVNGKFQFPSPFWDDISDEAKDLITNMLNVNPLERYSAKQVLTHEWVTNDDDINQTINNNDNIMSSNENININNNNLNKPKLYTVNENNSITLDKSTTPISTGMSAKDIASIDDSNDEKNSDQISRVDSGSSNTPFAFGPGITDSNSTTTNNNSTNSKSKKSKKKKERKGKHHKRGTNNVAYMGDGTIFQRQKKQIQKEKLQLRKERQDVERLTITLQNERQLFDKSRQIFEMERDEFMKLKESLAKENQHLLKLKNELNSVVGRYLNIQ